MKKFLVFTLLLISRSAFANDLELSKAVLYQENNSWYTVVSIKWSNAWKNNVNNDAAWVFFKVSEDGDGYSHIRLAATGHEVVESGEVDFEIYAPEDRMGFFVQPSSNYRGDVLVTVKIMLDGRPFAEVDDIYSMDFKAHGIEMVYIPEGGFTLGDPDEAALRYGAFYESGSDGEYKGLFSVQSEDQEIEVGQNDGNLFYRTRNRYQGDQTGTIPSTYPKGVRAFYIMKYEPTQGQYVDFLNSLNDGQTHSRANFAGKEYYSNRGSIYIKDGRYASKYPDATCNYMSWDDAMAYADWAGLRPLTEFEFAKAARGTGKPIANEYPWGTGSKNGIQRMVNDHGQFYMFNDSDESKLNNDTKETFGASYYWVMDLAGGMWERLITVGHPKGRSFLGTHGDGRLTGDGAATNQDWPNGLVAPGVGFRGGGYYVPGRAYNAQNPYSPIAYRPFGAYSGGQRTNSYGARFCRTAQ